MSSCTILSDITILAILLRETKIVVVHIVSQNFKMLKGVLSQLEPKTLLVHKPNSTYYSIHVQIDQLQLPKIEKRFSYLKRKMLQGETNFPEGP